MGRVGASRSGTAIVLFTDLVGSTEQRMALGEDRAEELRRTHDHLLGGAVSAHDGVVVKGLGDGIMATFSGAADALTAATSIQQAVERHSRDEPGLALRVRIGVSAGDVTWEDGDCFGAPVVEAARLCAAAGEGRILISDLVRALARGRGSHRFKPVGELALKGLPEPVAVCEVGWDPLPDARRRATVPLPPLLGSGEGAFAGRSDELATATAVLEDALGGRRRVLLLAGEPGIGKTRLAAEVAARGHAAGASVLYGRCEDELSAPFQPFVEALKHFVTTAGEVGAELPLGRYPGELVRLLPDLSARVPGVAPPTTADADTERYRLFEAVVSWVTAAADPQGLVLVLDDLHWAERSTHLLLRHLVHAAVEGPLLVIGTFRDTDLDADHPLLEALAEFRRVPTVTRLTLSGLDADSVHSLLDQVDGYEAADDGGALARAIRDHTEGNPFFIGETVRHLVESGAVARGGWTPGSLEHAGIPDGAREVIRRRLGRLSRPGSEVLAVAAAIGRDFDLATLAAAGRFTEDDVLDTVDAAAAARLVEETAPGRFRFSHAVVRATVYDEQTATRRVRTHARIAEAIEALRPDDVVALAYHYGEAVPVADRDRAVDYAVCAGDRAAAQLAWYEAVAHYRRAVELLDAGDEPVDEERRCDLLLALGSVERTIGDQAHRSTLLEAAAIAARRKDGKRAARAALVNQHVNPTIIGGHDAERVRAIESALDLIGDSDAVARSRLLATLAVESIWGPRRVEAAALAEEALTLARTSGDDEALVTALVAHGYTRGWRSPGRRGVMAAAQEQLDALERLGDQYRLGLAWIGRQYTAVTFGDRRQALDALERARQVAERFGSPVITTRVALCDIMWATAEGRLADAETLLDDTVELAGRMGYAAWHAGMAQHVRRHQGRVTETSDGPPGGAAPTFALPQRALDACDRGRTDEAQSILESLTGDDLGGVPDDYFRLQTLCVLSEVAHRLGHEGAACALAPHLEHFGGLMGGFGLVQIGAVDTYRAYVATTLGELDHAERLYAAGEDLETRMQFRALLARTQIAHAELLVLRAAPGDREHAQRLATTAAAAATRSGMAPVIERADALFG